tara:strand:- start:20 stop:694 length:675 start_codon:yes stop_codon:yes gene_type:complete
MIIITGASGGVGSRLFTEISKGTNTIGIYNNNKLKNSDNGLALKLDLLNQNSIKEFVETYKSKLKNITIIQLAVNSYDGLLADYPIENVHKTFELNIFSNISLIQSLLPLMIDQKWGRIIHTSSLVGVEGAVGAGIYASSKSALIGYSKTLSKEYARFGITSNILEMGYFESGLIESFDQKKINDIILKTSVRRLGNISDIISAITFIQDCSYFNGEILRINGG